MSPNRAGRALRPVRGGFQFVAERTSPAGTSELEVTVKTIQQ